MEIPQEVKGRAGDVLNFARVKPTRAALRNVRAGQGPLTQVDPTWARRRHN